MLFMSITTSSNWGNNIILYIKISIWGNIILPTCKYISNWGNNFISYNKISNWGNKIFADITIK